MSFELKNKGEFSVAAAATVLANAVLNIFLNQETRIIAFIVAFVGTFGMLMNHHLRWDTEKQLGLSESSLTSRSDARLGIAFGLFISGLAEVLGTLHGTGYGLQDVYSDFQKLENEIVYRIKHPQSSRPLTYNQDGRPVIVLSKT